MSAFTGKVDIRIGSQATTQSIHRNIQNTTRYTALAPDRFKSFWRD
jgi:hypothetical protein